MVKPMVLVPSRGRFWAWVWSVLGVVGLWALPVWGVNYVVTSTDDVNDGTCNASHCSLREAINAANATSADDTITFSVSGTIVLTSTLPTIASAGTAGELTIDGSGQNITISGNNSVRVMSVSSGANLTLQNLTIANGNAVGDVGGGIYNSGGTVTITSSTFSNNSAGLSGGGIANGFLATVTITNSTFSGNNAGNDGGGLSNGGGTVIITNSTFSNNGAPNGGGLSNPFIGTVTLKNTIIANSSSGGNCVNADIFNTIGVNFATDGTCPGFTTVTSAQLNLGPLAVNAPGTTATHALLSGSAAIDAAVLAHCPATDQRGISRPQGAQCDSGSYEADPARTLTVQKTGSGSGTVTDNFAQINCGATCTTSYGNGAAVTLTANAASGSTFAGWSGDCSGTSSFTQVTMTADKTCTATFLILFTLGDVNNDGKINTIDARMAQQHADGVITLTGNQFLAADVDQDSDVDSADATAIAKKGIGLPTGIPGFAQIPPSPQPSPFQGEGGHRPAEGLFLALLPMLSLLLLRRSRKVATLLLALGLVGTLTGCVEFAGLPPPSGSAIYLTSTSMPNGATRTIEIVVQEITAHGGVASLQGRITFPSGVAIQSVSGASGFVVKALCGVVGEPCAGPNELRFSLVKASAGGVSHGAVLRLAVSASGASGTVHTLSFEGNAQAPIVLGGDTNVEITGFSIGNGQVKVQ